MAWLRYMTAGESHGQGLVAILEGLPAGLPVDRSFVDGCLARRQGGFGRGGRMKIEQDRVTFLAGVRHGKTLGSPVAILLQNRDWKNWETVMSPDPAHAAAESERRVTRPRPGHGDLAGALKYGHDDIRNVLERASARETAARVAVGAVCQQLLVQFGITVVGHVVAIGGVRAEAMPEMSAAELRAAVANSPVYCADAEASQRMVEAIREAMRQHDSLGGVVEVRAEGVPPGLGSYVAWDRRLDGRLAASLMSIPAIKGVEIGLGFAAAARPGSQVHDEIFYRRLPEGGGVFYRETNHAGGIEAGVSNGEPVVVRAAMKPIPTLYKPLRSVDMASKEPFEASVERSDVCAVPAASVVAEAAVAFVLSQALLEKFAGDSLAELRAAYENYMASLRAR
ncbi:MAG: chorismate synthase [Clostridia bacterium]|nr:chorismate synthase [Clostridia bacterium]